MPDGSQRAVNSFFCVGGAARCEGYSVNHFYSESGATYSSGGFAWTGPKAVITTMGSCPSGTTTMYRNGVFPSGNDHRYYISVGAPIAGASYSESLSCIWP